MQRSHIHPGHCVRSVPDESQHCHTSARRKLLPLDWHALAALLVGKLWPKSMAEHPHARAEVNKQDKRQKIVCGGLLLYFKINKNATGTKMQSLKGKPLPLLWVSWPTAHTQAGVAMARRSRKRLKAPKVSSSLVSKQKWNLEMKPAA